MIEYAENNKVKLVCNLCGERNSDFNTLQEAANYARANGWKATRYRGDWEDMCPECLGGGENKYHH